jgi:MoxR-like ATPase
LKAGDIEVQPKLLKQARDGILAEISKVVVGNEEAANLMLVSLMCKGHVLLEGVPGLAKTTLAKAFSRTLGVGFRRIQFTPDLLPSDITGTYVFNQKEAEFRFRPGPLLSNIILADEINRAPPKTQAALLEAMQEQQMTVEGETHMLPRPFMVMATQNPVEQEGTYPLPEAQLDRFLMRIEVGYPSRDQEIAILRMTDAGVVERVGKIIDSSQILILQDYVRSVFVDQSIVEYIVDIVLATRSNKSILLGGSPRASIALQRCSQALALLEGRDFVIPDDVKEVVYPVLNHRLAMKAEAELSGVTVNSILDQILSSVQAPMVKQSAPAK